jgi:Flp pilus assembly pilin Flp
MSRMLRRFLADETGQDLVEYALLGALIAIVSVTTLRLLGEGLPKVFFDVWQALQPVA